MTENPYRMLAPSTFNTDPGGPNPQRRDARAINLVRRLGGRSIVLVGIMGSGKTSVGRRLAARLGLDFAAAPHRGSGNHDETTDRGSVSRLRNGRLHRRFERRTP
jgi:hypothetical protein